MKSLLTLEQIARNYFLRGLFILPLGLFGVMHFVYPDFFMDMVPAYAPGGVFWVYFSGFALSASSISMFTGYMGKLSSTLLIIFILTFIATVDLPRLIIDQPPDSRYYFMVSFLKDTSLLSGTILYNQIFCLKK